MQQNASYLKFLLLRLIMVCSLCYVHLDVLLLLLLLDSSFLLHMFIFILDIFLCHVIFVNFQTVVEFQ